MDRRGRPERRYSSEQGDLKASSHHHSSKKLIHDTVPPLPPQDPRLSNDKYRAQMKSLKSQRISPDTTMKTSSTKKTEDGSGSTKLAPNASFSCSLCPLNATTMFDSIGGVRAHLQQLHAIEGQDIWDPLTRIPKAEFLKSYKCKACPPTARPSVVQSEDKMLEHFKDKHKIPVLKPFLLNRICRLCEKDGFKNDVEIDKHIVVEHPADNYHLSESEEGESNDFQASTSKADEDYFKKDEDELNYEPEDDRSPSPAREETSVPEDGECSDTYQKSKYQPRKRSASSSSRTSRSSSRSRSKKKKKVPKQYKDSSRSSSSESRIHHPVRPSGGGSRRSPSPLPGKRKVYIDKSPKKNKDDLFGQTYIPPQGFCDECNERYESGDRAQDHFKSQRHYWAVKGKFRCYFCNAYVSDTKAHLESRHRDMTFQCKLNGCNKPRFTQAAKVIDHVRTNHPRDYKKTQEDIDMFRLNMISMPKSLCSYTCKQCKVVFHGDVKIAIVHLVLEHGVNVPQRHHLDFSCRLCGPRKHFKDEIELANHCENHYKDAFGSGSGSRRSSPSRSRSISRSISRSRSRSPYYSGGPQNRDRNQDRFDHRDVNGFRDRGHVKPSQQGQSGGRGGLNAQHYGGSDRAHHGTGSGGSLSCHFCPDVFRTPAIRKNHMLHHHQKFLFQCGLCTFHNMYRRDLAWHLREHHRKNLPDDVLVREFVHWPEDMRKIMCGKCNESEAHDNAVWMGVDPNNVMKELRAHASQRHGIKDENIDSCFILCCSGCTVKFEMDGEIRDWDDHMHDAPCKRGRNKRSRTRSRSPADRSRDVSPVEINLETHCVYCCKQVDDKSEMVEHVRKRHLDAAFVCRLCETGDKGFHFESDLPSAKEHLKQDHNKDDLDNEDDIMDYFRIPKNLSCIKCNLCGLMCHAQKVEDLELHFNVVHPGSKFSENHLDFLCRICMIPGQNDTMEELKDHLYDKHPDYMK